MKETNNAPKGLRKPSIASGSEAYVEFARAQMKAFDFANFVTRTARELDRAVEAISKVKEAIASKADSATAIAEMRRASQEYAEHRSLLDSFVFADGVNNFLTYVSDVLVLIYRARPETMKSNETLRTDYVLNFPTMEALLHSLAERKVRELSYRQISDLADYMCKRLGIEPFLSEDQSESVARIIDERNIITHSRGVYNEFFVSKYHDVAIGERLALSPSVVTEKLKLLVAVARNLDLQVVEKFKLPTQGVEI